MRPNTPGWLEDSLRAMVSASPGPAAVHVGPSTPRPGEVRRLEPMDHGGSSPHLVLVTDVDRELASASVVALSNDVEMGSDIDRLLPRGVSGLPYDLVVLPDVVGPVWFVQLGPALASVAEDVADLPPAGIPLRDQKDFRWAWKERRLDQLVALTAECRYQLLDGELTMVVDPAAFDLDLVANEDRAQMTIATINLCKSQSIRVSTNVLRSTAVSNKSPAYESYVALTQTIPRYPHLLYPDALYSGDMALHRGVEDDPLPNAIAGLIAKLDDNARCIRVATISSLWNRSALDSEAGYFGISVEGRRHQMVLSKVDHEEGSRV